MTYIGVDIGKSGAITVLNSEGFIVEIIKTPENLQDFKEFLDKYKEDSVALIEQIHSQPDNGVKAAFSFGEINGITKTMFYMMGIPHHFISPQGWVKFYGMKKEKDEQNTSWKNRLAIKAQQLFPKNKIYIYQADSVLIANYLIKNINILK